MEPDSDIKARSQPSAAASAIDTAPEGRVWCAALSPLTFETPYAGWLAEQNAQFEAEGLWNDDLRVWSFGPFARPRHRTTAQPYTHAPQPSGPAPAPGSAWG
ncbi:MAG TPA: hypothetical protein PLU79_17135 [Burkholderiaceae bacterium]|nr:hypothetical protein [Burkholderiaceae bacterium]